MRALKTLERPRSTRPECHADLAARRWPACVAPPGTFAAVGFNANDTNLNRYVGNAPTIATDPSGLQGLKTKPRVPVEAPDPPESYFEKVFVDNVPVTEFLSDDCLILMTADADKQASKGGEFFDWRNVTKLYREAKKRPEIVVHTDEDFQERLEELVKAKRKFPFVLLVGHSSSYDTARVPAFLWHVDPGTPKEVFVFFPYWDAESTAVPASAKRRLALIRELVAENGKVVFVACNGDAKGHAREHYRKFIERTRNLATFLQAEVWWSPGEVLTRPGPLTSGHWKWIKIRPFPSSTYRGPVEAPP